MHYHGPLGSGDGVQSDIITPFIQPAGAGALSNGSPDLPPHCLQCLESKGLHVW